MLLLSSAEFSKLTFSKNSFKNTIRVSKSLDPGQDRHYVGPDLGPNCLQRLSTDDKSRRSNFSSDLAPIFSICLGQMSNQRLISLCKF